MCWTSLGFLVLFLSSKGSVLACLRMFGELVWPHRLPAVVMFVKGRELSAGELHQLLSELAPRKVFIQ